MVFVIGFGVLAFLSFVFYQGIVQKEWMKGCVGGFLFGAACASFGMAIAVGFGNRGNGHIETRRHAIVALHDGSSMRGRFFLGVGSFEGKPHYTYYEKTADGSFELKRVVASEARVYEEERTNGFLVTRQERGGWGLFTFRDDQEIHYEFHIPKGSTERHFALDAK